MELVKSNGEWTQKWKERESTVNIVMAAATVAMGLCGCVSDTGEHP